MSSRVHQKEAARQRRMEIEAEERRAAQKRRMRIRLAAIATAAIAVTSLAVSISHFTKEDAIAEPAAVSARFAGIPQDGTRLGSPSAPVTLVEFADLQCPFCGEYARNVLPTIIDKYVRPGKLKLELNLLTFVGEDSLKAGKLAAATTSQDRFWGFTDAFFAAQGQENTGYVTDDFLKETASAAGADYDAAKGAADGATAERVLKQAQDHATRLGVSSTPTFYLRRGHDETPLKIDDLDPATFTAALDEALR
jgi:protein-disulfide isomerase